MLLADRGFANHELIGWLRTSRWHYAIRLPADVLLHGARRYPTVVGSMFPPVGEACLYRQVGLWLDGAHRCNLVLATVKGAKQPWAVITDESPTLQTLWQYALRFRVEELFLDSKSGAFEERRFPFTLNCRARTLVSGCSHCPVVRHNSRFGSATSRLAATGRPSLAARHQLSQNRSALAARRISQKTRTAHSRSTPS